MERVCLFIYIFLYKLVKKTMFIDLIFIDFLDLLRRRNAVTKVVH